jgi:hypothetical protein
MFRKSLLVAALLVGTSLGAQAGTVVPLTNATPFDGVIYGFVLTDGTLLFQGGLLQDFYRFKPDKKGSYVNGTLYPAASLPPNYIPYATSGGVLPDGRVLLIGGEYKLLSNNTLTLFFTKQMAIYDPKADSWTMVAPPTGPQWDFIGDSPWTLLPNGKLLLGHKFSKAMAEFDPATMKWTEVSSFAKDDGFAEEGLTLLPDGSVLTVNMVDVNKAQRYISFSDTSKNRWDPAGSTPGQLPAIGDTNSAKNLIYDNGKRVYHPTGEIGPGMLRPDGTVFWSGAACTLKGPSTDPNACVNYKPIAPTAVYHIDTNNWTAGPDLPSHGSLGGEGAGDTWSSILPNGNVLVQTNPPGITDDPVARANLRYASIRNATAHLISAEAEGAAPACPPTSIWRLYEFDCTNLIPEPAASLCNNQPSLLLLPTGQVMMNLNLVYTSTNGTFQNAWRPTITQFTQNLDAGGNYQIWGTQFTGLSQANDFGDEFASHGNFPMVRITNNATGDVRYAHTYNWTPGVSTGPTVVSTWFHVPTNAETGSSTLEVVANGIPSQPVNVTIHVRTAASAN